MLLGEQRPGEPKTAVSMPAEPRVDLRAEVHGAAEQDELPPGWAVSVAPDSGPAAFADVQRYQAQLAAAHNAAPLSALGGAPVEHCAADGVSAAHAPSSAPRPQAPPVITIDDDTDSADDSSSGDEDADVPLAVRIAAQPPRLVPALGEASRKRSATQPPGINAEEVTLDIVCGGVVAKLVLPPRFKRNQARVLYAGSVITPSQFEASCGRDVRKKWRSTLRVLCADGTEGVAVGKWMAENVEAGATAPQTAPPAYAPPAPPPAPSAPPPAAKLPAAEAAERLHAQVEALIGDDSVLLADHAATFVQVLAGAETLAARTFTTRVLEQTVQLVSADAPVLVALVESEALTPLEAFVEAAAGERDAELLLRTLRLLDALPVTMAALTRCGLGKRCNKLQKFSASAGLAGTPAATAATEVDKAAARLVAKWKAQVNAETLSASVPALAVPAAKKPRVAPPAAATAKPARALADDDMFNGPGKGKAAPAPVRPTVRVSVVSDAEARALAARAAAPTTATAAVSPRLAPGAAPSGVAAMPAMERLARERAARDAAAAAAAAQRAAEFIQKERQAVKDAQLWFSELYPEGVVQVPEVLSAPPPSGPLTSNIPIMHVPPAERASRDRKRKRKGVVWAPEASLLQVRVFKKDEPLAGESVAYPDPATAGLGAAGGDLDMLDMPSNFAERVAQRDSAAERRTAESWRQRMPDPMYVAPPLMTAVHAWWCPPPARLAVPLPGENVLPPACGEGSSERQTQLLRESARPAVVYQTLASVPDHPAQGLARAERPVDNSKAPVINAGDPAPVALPMPMQQQYVPPPQPMQLQMPQQMPQQQPSYIQMPMQLQQPQQPQSTLQQQLFNQMLGMPQQQPLQQMAAPQQQPQQQQQMAWMGQQPMQPQVQQMQPQMQQMQAQMPQMQQQMQAPAQQGLGGWLQQPQAAPQPQQPMPAVSGLLQEWIMKSAGAPAAQQPAPAPASNALSDLLRSLEAGGLNSSALQQALLQVGSAPAPASAVPGPRPPPGPPPATAHAPAMVGQWPQPQQQQQQQMYSAPPAQSSFTSTLPQASFFDRAPLPNTGLPPQGSSGYKRGPCAFFNTPRGCRNGDACKFSHS